MLPRYCFDFKLMCILCVTVLSAFGCAPPIVTPVQIGTSNLAVQNQILHLNKIAEMRVRGDFRNLAVYLEKSLKKYSNDNFATRRLLNELASIYSYNCLLYTSPSPRD